MVQQPASQRLPGAMRLTHHLGECFFRLAQRVHNPYAFPGACPIQLQYAARTRFRKPVPQIGRAGNLFVFGALNFSSSTMFMNLPRLETISYAAERRGSVQSADESSALVR